MSHDVFKCPHCEKPLRRWEPAPESGWDRDLFYCDNDACSYFVRGREKVCHEFERNFAYRYCLDPKTGKARPVVAWCGGRLSLLKGRCGPQK